MLKLTKTGIGLLTRQYRSVLRKCWMINVGLFALGAAGVMVPNEAEAVNCAALTASSSMADVAACMGVFQLPDQADPWSNNIAGWDTSNWKAHSRRNPINPTNVAASNLFMFEDYKGHYTISTGATILQNLEALDAYIGGIPVVTDSHHNNYSYINEIKTNGTIGAYSLNPAQETLSTQLMYLDWVVGYLQNGTYISATESVNNNIKSLDTAVAGKQATLTAAQLNAANSGITSSKVSTYDGYADTIATKTTLSEVREINDLNNYYTKYGLGGKKQLSSLAVCGASPRQGISTFGKAASISDIALRKGQIP